MQFDTLNNLNLIVCFFISLYFCALNKLGVSANYDLSIK